MLVDQLKQARLAPTISKPQAWLNSGSGEGSPRFETLEGSVSGAARPSGDVEIVIGVSRDGIKLGSFKTSYQKTSLTRPNRSVHSQRLFEIQVHPAESSSEEQIALRLVNYRSDGKTQQFTQELPNLGNSANDLVIAIEEVCYENLLESGKTELVTYKPYGAVAKQSPFSLTVDGKELNPAFVIFSTNASVKAARDLSVGRSLTE